MYIMIRLLSIIAIATALLIPITFYSKIASDPPTAEERNAAFKEQCGYDIPSTGDILYFKNSNHEIIVHSVILGNYIDRNLRVIYPQSGLSQYEPCQLFQIEMPKPKFEDLRQ